MVYLRYEYAFPENTPDDFIGPFPDTSIARLYRDNFGPLLGKIVELDSEPDPEHTMSPGQALDHSLKRY